MLLGGMAIYAYIVMYGDNAGEMVCCLVHAYLKDVLGDLQTEWHVQEMVPAMMGVERGQVARFLIEVYAPEVILSIQLTEASSTAELMQDLTESRGFILLSHNALVKVLWVKAYAWCTIRLGGYDRDNTHSVGRGAGAIIALVTMSSRVTLSALSTLWVPSFRHDGQGEWKGWS